MEVVVQSLNQYNFKNDDGEQVVGAKLSYFLAEKTKTDKLEGHPPLQCSVNTNQITNLVQVPAIYDFAYDMKPGKNNKPEMVLTTIKFIKEVDFSKLVQNVPSK